MSDTKNLKEVTVPLKVEELKDLIEKKDSFYIVQYKSSQLRDIVFLNYISNLNLPCEVQLEGCDFNEKESLLKAYLTTRNIVNVNSLRLNIARIILENRGINTTDIFINPLLTREEVKSFIDRNKDVLSKWEQFLESTIVFAMFTSKDLNEEVNIKSEVPVIDDPNFVGSNIVNLFSIPSFMEVFFTVGTRQELSFFQPQFEEYMFKGKNLYEYYFCEENEVYKLFIGQVHGSISADDLINAQKGADALLTKKLEK